MTDDEPSQYEYDRYAVQDRCVSGFLPNAAFGDGPPIFGLHRLPEYARECPAWRSTGGYNGTSAYNAGKPRGPVGTPAPYKAHQRLTDNGRRYAPTYPGEITDYLP